MNQEPFEKIVDGVFLSSAQFCVYDENVGKVSASKSYKTLTKKRKKLIKLRESKSFVAIVAFPCWQKTSSSTYFFSIVLISF